MGDDLTVVNAARVSFDKESDWEWDLETFKGDIKFEPGTVFKVTKSLSERDDRLIHYLASHKHWTPFSHPQVTLRETVPIFVARQRFKHVVGFSYNEVSRRYVDSIPEFYEPKIWRARAENKKQGSSDKPIEDKWVPAYWMEVTETCMNAYTKMLQAGVAPEQARMVLPQSMYTSYYVTGSLAAWARAYKLRASEDAQSEIRELAADWDRIIRPLYPKSWEALVA